MTAPGAEGPTSNHHDVTPVHVIDREFLAVAPPAAPAVDGKHPRACHRSAALRRMVGRRVENLQAVAPRGGLALLVGHQSIRRRGAIPGRATGERPPAAAVAKTLLEAGTSRRGDNHRGAHQVRATVGARGVAIVTAALAVGGERLKASRRGALPSLEIGRKVAAVLPPTTLAGVVGRPSADRRSPLHCRVVGRMVLTVAPPANSAKGVKGTSAGRRRLRDAEVRRAVAMPMVAGTDGGAPSGARPRRGVGKRVAAVVPPKVPAARRGVQCHRRSAEDLRAVALPKAPTVGAGAGSARQRRARPHRANDAPTLAVAEPVKTSLRGAGRHKARPHQPIVAALPAAATLMTAAAADDLSASRRDARPRRGSGNRQRVAPPTRLAMGVAPPAVRRRAVHMHHRRGSARR
mmetsp:Transcript_17460/g.47758  ORF Transcript_17460/g.47758 Transcript_17460/m.47758 type:complete len:406 (-) Transcript_17460:1799-3016(-)